MNMTVVGMNPDGVVLERLGITISYRTAVLIQQHQTNDPELQQALQERRLFSLGGHMPPGSSFKGATASVAQPNASISNQLVSDLRAQVDTLQATVRDKDAQILRLEGLLAQQALANPLLETLSKMQATLSNIESKGISMVSGGPLQVSQQTTTSGFDEVPMFIPSAKRNDIKADFEVQSKESSTDISSAKGALKNLKKDKG